MSESSPGTNRWSRAAVSRAELVCWAKRLAPSPSRQWQVGWGGREASRAVWDHQELRPAPVFPWGSQFGHCFPQPSQLPVQQQDFMSPFSCGWKPRGSRQVLPKLKGKGAANVFSLPITRLRFRVVGYLLENFVSIACFANTYKESQSSVLKPGISRALGQRGRSSWAWAMLSSAFGLPSAPARTLPAKKPL